MGYDFEYSFQACYNKLLVLLSGCLSKSFCSAEEKIVRENENLSFKIALKKLGDMQRDINKQVCSKQRRENRESGKEGVILRFISKLVLKYTKC